MTARTARGAAIPAVAKRNVAIRRLTDRESVRARLNTSRAFAAYAIAYLDPRMFPLADFFEATSSDRWALVMHARGGLGQTALSLGDPTLATATMRLHPGPRQTFLTAEVAHIDPLLASHNLWRPQTMLRMRVPREHFVRPVNPPPVRRLVHLDAPDLNRLYAIEGDGLRYSGRQVMEGIYYGAHVRGRLVAAAGTHIYSHGQSVGVVGNVFTHPDFRGHGLGTAVTSAVTGHLLQTCDLVVLNVDPANRTARHIYETLGYEETGRLVEAMVTRREGSWPPPWLRRLLARWRGREAGTELIRV